MHSAVLLVVLHLCQQIVSTEFCL